MAATSGFEKTYRLTRATPLSLSNKIGRATWNVVWLLLFCPTPKPFHVWRSVLLGMFGAKLGKAVHPYPHSCLSQDVGCIGPHATVSQYSFLCTVSHDYKDPAMPLVTARSRLVSARGLRPMCLWRLALQSETGLLSLRARVCFPTLLPGQWQQEIPPSL